MSEVNMVQNEVKDNVSLDMTSVIENIAEKEPDIEKKDIEVAVNKVVDTLTENNNSYDIETLSDGVKYIINGYFEYIQEVISDRALPELRDGFKPVNRRITYTLHNGKYKNFIKSGRIVGDVMGTLHPHGDASIYEAMVLMTDKNGGLAFPLVAGRGNLGGVYKTDPPAAMRYTEVKIHSNCEEYFQDMNGINMIPNFDATTTEPEVLPVRFPAVLVNSTSGIAVGFRSNIPSFNFVDVCELVKEYINKGTCETIIYPDFVTGGYYVKNDKEAMKLMKYGMGKIKLRGRTEINGKEISVTEIPYGKTIQGLVKQINDKDIKSIRNAYDADDFDHGLMFCVDCKSKASVNDALNALYKESDFQYTYSADITVVENGLPKRYGVWTIIEHWVKWRKEVLSREYNARLHNIENSILQSRAFMEIMKYPEKKEQLVLIITKEGSEKGVEFILNNYDNDIITPDLARWICQRRLADFHNGGKYADQYKDLLKQLDICKNVINDTDSEILRQMDELIHKYGSVMKRRTEVTDVDYVFDSSTSALKVKDTSSCVYDYKDGFLRKLKTSSKQDNLQFEFKGNASDTLIAFDNRGRLLRIYCSDIPFVSSSEMGIYLPRYFNFEEESDYRITYLGKLDGSLLMLLYTDGNVGFVDQSEWLNNKRSIKVLEKGISVANANKLGAVVNLSGIDNIDNKVLFEVDNRDHMGWVYIKDIKRKDRTARTKVFSPYRDAYLTHYMIVPDTESNMVLNNLDKYYGKLRNAYRDFIGNTLSFKKFT